MNKPSENEDFVDAVGELVGAYDSMFNEYREGAFRQPPKYEINITRFVTMKSVVDKVRQFLDEDTKRRHKHNKD